MNSRLTVQRHSLFYELPSFGRNIILDHGQFNNCLSSHLPSKKYLESLRSIHDLDLFSLNTGEAQNPDFNLNNHRIQSSYFSPHSFNVFKVNCADMVVTQVSPCSIIMSEVLSVILKIFRFIY